MTTTRTRRKRERKKKVERRKVERKEKREEREKPLTKKTAADGRRWWQLRPRTPPFSLPHSSQR
jgi:hypothetical protein